MQFKTLCLSASLGMACHLSAHAQPATFDVETQELKIPLVELMLKDEKVGAFEVEMQLVPNTIASDFTIKKLTPLGSVPSSGTGTMLDRIKKRMVLICGVGSDVNSLKGGFTFINENGQIAGFDVDLCRAVAAAILNNPNAVSPTMLRQSDRQGALEPGNIDMLTATTTWTSSREANWGNFTWITFYDGQGFIVKKDTGISTLEQLEGKNVCVLEGTTTITNLKEVFAQRGISFTPLTFSEATGAFAAYEQDQCTAYTSDRSILASWIFSSNTPDAHIFIDETISKEPLTPSVPFGDDMWVKIVRTIIFGLINAEELGITQANIDTMMSSDNPQVKRLLGVEGSFGQAEIGLETDAIARAIRAVGNYGEIYERNLGSEGIGLPRGLNRLWTEGGLIYAPPLR
jgi:general L-amino acid transport system substrate-binding protein